MKPKVYIETTIPGYLTARPSRDPIATSHQRVTREWWRYHRRRFDLFVSDRVLVGTAVGNPILAARRLAALKGLPELLANAEARNLARKFLARGALPEKALEDAIHVAISSVHDMDYLITWNCRHIANAAIVRRLEVIAAGEGYSLPVLCTPAQLMGD